MARRVGALRRVAGATSNVAELFNIVREMSFDELREEAQAAPRLLLLGADQAALEPLRDQLGGSGSASYIDTAAFDQPPRDLAAYDGIVLVNAGPTDRARPEIQRLLAGAETAGRTLTFQIPPSLARDDRALATVTDDLADDLRRRILTRLSHRQLALGRYLPAFRGEAAQSVTNATARANAEFALLSNIPAVIPVVGNLVAAGADFLVLTKNQLMLIYKLAAIHGRDIQQPWRLYTEMLPVVGAGLVWRTVARELASFVPFAGGTIPKVIIAYAGTAVVGQAAHFFYEQGKKPSNEQLRRFYARAAEVARSLRLSLPGRANGHDVIEGQFTERKAPQPPASETEAATMRPAAEATGQPSPQDEVRPTG